MPEPPASRRHDVGMLHPLRHDDLLAGAIEIGDD
jgi:hypothetical protein